MEPWAVLSLAISKSRSTLSLPLPRYIPLDKGDSKINRTRIYKRSPIDTESLSFNLLVSGSAIVCGKTQGNSVEKMEGEPGRKKEGEGGTQHL